MRLRAKGQGLCKLPQALSDTAKPEDVRGFHLHLTSSGAAVPKINVTISVLRFFFKVTLAKRKSIDAVYPLICVNVELWRFALILACQEPRLSRFTQRRGRRYVR